MQGIQKKFEQIGKHGCYLLCLLRTANKENRALEYYDKYLTSGYIDEECTVLRPDLIMLDLHKKSYRVSKCGPEVVNDPIYKDKKHYIIIEYWFNPRTKLHHFKLHNWDSFGKSVTCSEGFIESTRVFELVGNAA